MVEFFHHIHKTDTHTEKKYIFKKWLILFYVAFAKVNSLNTCLLLKAVKSEVKRCIL